MSIEDEANERTKYIADSIERERRYKNLVKVLTNLAAAADIEEGRVPFRQPRDQNKIKSITPAEYDQRESARIKELVDQNILTDEPELPAETATTGDDINARGKFGYTRLHQAVVDGNLDEVRRLKGYPGIDLTIRDNSGATAYEKALAVGEDEIATELKSADNDNMVSVTAEDDAAHAEDGVMGLTEEELESFLRE